MLKLVLQFKAHLHPCVNLLKFGYLHCVRCAYLYIKTKTCYACCKILILRQSENSFASTHFYTVYEHVFIR